MVAEDVHVTCLKFPLSCHLSSRLQFISDCIRFVYITDYLPSPPRNLNAKVSLQSKILQVFWDPPEDNAVNLTHYVLYINRTGVPDGTIQRALVSVGIILSDSVVGLFDLLRIFTECQVQIRL